MATVLVQILVVSILIANSGCATPEFCDWTQFRAAVVRDQLWIDGGLLWNATDLLPVDSFYYINFSSPFDTTQDLKTIFNNVPKISGQVTNIAPNFVGGGMLANDYEFCLFGGLEMETESESQLNQSNIALCRELYNDDPSRALWSTILYNQVPQTMTTYVSNGASANAPSENLSFYFSGMQSPTGAEIGYNLLDATMEARSFIEVDMTIAAQGVWTNHTLPDFILPRADSQLVWVPVSTRGILVAVGGVINPEEIYDGSLGPEQAAQSRQQSPDFMKSIPVYDIGSNFWYLQNATAQGDFPPQLSSFCSTLAVSNDSSSFQLYIYGGYDGINPDDAPYDDVWILSMPSFTWIKAYTGVPAHGRSSHYCAQPYPNLMFVVGGINETVTSCVDGIIQVFNLNTLMFEDSYDPAMPDYTYKVPSKVYSAIGGNAMGGATATATWSNPDLGRLFQTPYPSQIQAWYPYHPTFPSSSPGSSPHPWLAPVIGVLAGLVMLSVIAFAIICFCRRRNKHRRVSSNEYEVASLPSDWGRNRVSRWMRGMPDTAILHGAAKSEPSVTTTELDDAGAVPRFHEAGGESRPLGSASPNDRTSQGSVPGSSGQQRFSSSQNTAAENADSPAHELCVGGSLVEMATPYHFQRHPDYPRSIDYAVDQSSPNQHITRGATRFPNHNGSPDLPSSNEYAHMNTSPSLDGSIHHSAAAVSPPRPSPEAELPADRTTGMTPGNSIQRPSHNRNISSMSDLPASSTGVPDPIHEEQGQRQTFSQYVPEHTPNLPSGLPRMHGTEFENDFGPDGWARSASVVMRKAVGSRSNIGSPTVGSPLKGPSHFVQQHDGDRT